MLAHLGLGVKSSQLTAVQPDLDPPRLGATGRRTLDENAERLGAIGGTKTPAGRTSPGALRVAFPPNPSLSSSVAQKWGPSPEIDDPSEVIVPMEEILPHQNVVLVLGRP